MDLRERVRLMVKLGEYMQTNNNEWLAIKDRAARENAWFTEAFIDLSINNICKHFLL